MAVRGTRVGRGRWGLVAATMAVFSVVAAIFALPAAANPPDPTRPDIELTVRASIDRPFTWEIDKSADVETLKLKPGETATVNYSVTVKETEGATGWSAFGEILVYNKDLEPVMVNSVTNVVSGVGPATVTCQGAALPRQLNSGAQLRCRFTIDLPDNTDRVSTATASVGSGEFTASAPITFATALDNRIDTCVAIYDSLLGLLDEQTCVNKVNKTVTYSTVVGPYGECGEYRVENTAWAITNHTETRVEDTNVVKVSVECPRPCKLGDYVWVDKNKDGVQNESSGYGVNGVRLELLDAAGNVVATTTTADHPYTGKAGYYRFTVTCGVAYKVRVKASNFGNGGALDDYTATQANVGSDAFDSDGNTSTNTSHSVTVASGSDYTVDFGYVKKKDDRCKDKGKYGWFWDHKDKCDRDDDCDRDKYGKYGHDRDDKWCRDDRDDHDRDRCRDDHWNDDDWGRDWDRDDRDKDKWGWH